MRRMNTGMFENQYLVYAKSIDYCVFGVFDNSFIFVTRLKEMETELNVWERMINF
jgi:hypothetical protein